MSASKIHMRGPLKRGICQSLCLQGRPSTRVTDDWQLVTCLYCIRPHLAELTESLRAANNENIRLRRAADAIDSADFAGENCCFCGGPVVIDADEKHCGLCGATEEQMG